MRSTMRTSSDGTSRRRVSSGCGVRERWPLTLWRALPLGKRGLAGEQFVEGAAEAVDVGADVGEVRIAGLLGGDVVGRAHDEAGVRQADGRRFCRRSGGGLDFQRQRRIAGALSTTKRARPKSRILTWPAGRQHQVVRLDVAVDHAALVGVLQAERGLADVVARLGHRQRAASRRSGGPG